MVRKALVLLLALLVAMVPLVSGCAGDGAPGPGDNSTPTDNVPAGPGPDGPGPTEPEPTEPTEPAGPEFPQGLFGAVFDDGNGNGVREAGEAGIKGVLVSNGIACRPTNSEGVYNLPSDNSLVFVTVPGDRTSTGAWYAVPSTDNIDFGLRQTPEKAAAAGAAGFTFVQVTDLHASQAQADELAELAADINALAPAFVIATGDLINDGNGATVATAAGWFDVYQGFAASLEMPVYQAVGNHDVVGIHRSDADTADPGYGEGMFISRFGPTCYSFDWGRYHCIVLDPNDMEGGKQVYRIPQAQVRWLTDDLSYRGEAPLLVFYHEPSTSWANRSEVLALFQGRSAELFCGHLHQCVTLDSSVSSSTSGSGSASGLPEHITAAVCGEWWRGPNPDGKPQGYRLVSAGAGGVDSLYMGTGEARTVDFGLSPVVSGNADLAVKIYSRSGPGGSPAGVTAGLSGVTAGLSGVTLQVDDNQTLAVTLDSKDGVPWSVAAAPWDTASLSEGYHHLTLRASDAGGAFEKRFDFKKSLSGTVTPADLATHREVFWGAYVAVEAQPALMLTGPWSLGSISVPAGMGFLMLRDGSDALVVVAGEVFSPPLPLTMLLVPAGTTVVVKVALVRVTMAQIMSSGEWDAYYPLVTDFVGFIPDSAKEPPGVASVTDLTAVWGGRWLDAGDFTLRAPG